MANFTTLNDLIAELFVVLGTLMNGLVELMTGDLIVLVVVGLIFGLIIALIGAVIIYIRKLFGSSLNMKK